MQRSMLEIKNLKKYFPVKGSGFFRPRALVKAVDGVSFTLDKGETLGLVGESGCGKSTVGRLILGLIRPTEGEIFFQGRNIPGMDRKELRLIKRDIQLIFQDPYGSLNPRMTAGDIVGEALEIHRIAKGKDKEKRVEELLELVGLKPQHKARYPHQLSGGQRQRIAIARALAVGPRLIVCDEPVSSLDVSVQAQVIDLMQELQQRLGQAYLFISHDLGVIRHISDRVAVMYLGRIVELAHRDQVFDRPAHPYTQAMLAAAPAASMHSRGKRVLLEGEVPNAINPPGGCRFHTRCVHALPVCSEVEPVLSDLGGGHLCACHLY
jgi:oligopeptide transport system ATP-binding protein